MTTSEPKLAEADGTHLNSCGPKDTLCQLCGLPQIGSNQVRPNGLRGCKCNELSPHYKVPDPPRSVQPSILHPDSLKANLDAYVIGSCQPQLSKINSSGTPSSLKMDMCSQKETVPKEVTFEPPQGMDAGQYPRSLFYQYYPNQNKSYTFHVLPLPFLERLNYNQISTLSIDNEDIKQEWKEFVYNLPNKKYSSVLYPDEKFWRWKTFLRYKPDETGNDFRYKMQTGPKYDNKGRLPITGEELDIYRNLQKIKFKSTTNVKHTLKKGSEKQQKLTPTN